MTRRRCVSCRMLRLRPLLFSVTYSRLKNQFSFNGEPSLQGRSAYVCRNPECLKTAIRGRKMQKALKRAIPDVMLRCLDESFEQVNSAWQGNSQTQN